MTEKIAVYPGTFDPITKGHLDIIKRSLQFCTKCLIAIPSESNKTTYFSSAQRADLIRSCLLEYRAAVSVIVFEGLLVDLIEEQKANFIIRGLRVAADFDYELQMAHMNQRLSGHIETIFLPTRPELSYISSSLVKEIAMHGKDVSAFVPPAVAAALKEKK